MAKADPTTGIAGVKMEQQLRSDESQIHVISVRGDWKRGQVTAAVKAGADTAQSVVEGPVCIEPADDSSATNGKDGADVTVEVKSVLLKVEIVNNILVIIGKAEGAANVSGTWTFDVGGAIHTVKGKGDIRYEIELPPVGVYGVSGQFQPENGSSAAKAEPVVVEMPTDTGGTLPNTSTPWHNLLLAGGIAMAGGAVLLVRNILRG